VLADPKDVEHLLKEIHKPVLVHFEPLFGHLDPTLGQNCYQTIYPIVLKLIKKYQHQG